MVRGAGWARGVAAAFVKTARLDALTMMDDRMPIGHAVTIDGVRQPGQQ